MSLNDYVNRFRTASRELFNHYFRLDDPYTEEDAWNVVERFSDVQELLFQKLVSEPASLTVTPYGKVQTEIVVKPIAIGASVPWLLNREMNSGYWDGQPRQVAHEARLHFISFFDWDEMGIRDNRYVRVIIESWPSHSELAGKHALVEAHYVRFVEG
jgi:hypothetical protein